MGSLLGARVRKVGSLHGVIIGGQRPKSGFPSWGHFGGPGSEKWGPFMGSLMGARVQKVGSLHRVIFRGQGPKTGVHSSFSCSVCGLINGDIIRCQWGQNEGPIHCTILDCQRSYVSLQMTLTADELIFHKICVTYDQICQVSAHAGRGIEPTVIKLHRFYGKSAHKLLRSFEMTHMVWSFHHHTIL